MIADDEVAQLTVRSKPRLCFAGSAPRGDGASPPVTMNGQPMTPSVLHGMKRDARSKNRQEKANEKLSRVAGCRETRDVAACAKPAVISLFRTLIYAGCVIVPWAVLGAGCTLLVG
jgi:hypothetical protein